MRAKRPWLASPAGINFVAVGIVAMILCLFVFFVKDVLVLFEIQLGLGWLREFYYLTLAALASLFSVYTFVIWRPWLPRITMLLFGLAMVSHIAEHWISLPSPYLRVVAAARLLVSLAVVALVFRYRSAERSQAAA